MHVQLLLILTAALAACGGTMPGSEAMRSAISDAIAEDQIHLSNADVITMMPTMFDEVDRHTSRMNAIMASMGDHMMSMQHCSGIQPMMNLRESMRAEVSDHAASMHMMTDIGTARTDVEHHVSTMQAMLDDMGMMLDVMQCGGARTITSDGAVVERSPRPGIITTLRADPVTTAEARAAIADR